MVITKQTVFFLAHTMLNKQWTEIASMLPLNQFELMQPIIPMGI